MDNPAGSDKSLLDRLNALKPTTVSLDPPSESTPASNITSVKSASRADALSERLKTLRSQPESQVSAASSSDLQRNEAGSNTSLQKAQPPSSSTPAESGTIRSPYTVSGSGEVGTLLDTDDQTLEEMLADLGSDEGWLDEVAADNEHRRVTALLEELDKTSVKGESNVDEVKVGEEDADDVNSDDEHVTREDDDVLAQAVDEAEWEKANEPPASEISSPIGKNAKIDKSSPREDADEPSIGSKDYNQDRFNLPTVPSEQQDQPDLADSSGQDHDFVADILSRMTALKGLGGSGRQLPSAPTAQVDDLGLPGVPTFSPEDRPLRCVYKRYGYTDEEQKTWCIICLEDGTIRCLDCDDDIYCARCWKEMHVGPQAGYDERGHKWEKFVKNI